jgi:hypothetical protein
MRIENLRKVIISSAQNGTKRSRKAGLRKDAGIWFKRRPWGMVVHLSL